MTGRDGGAPLAPLDPSPAVILVRPQLADNIGAAARAMANGGLFHLRLVAPRDGWPQDRAWRTASGADRILEEAAVFPTVADAVADLHRVLATCPRPRHVIVQTLTARGAAAELRDAGARGLRTGVLFGPERAGLDRDDLAHADALVRYPLNPAFASLNLAQAVMVMAYEWWTAADETPPAVLATNETRVATKGELEGFLRHLVAELDACGFLRNLPKRPGMVRNLRHFFERGEVTEQELRTLHGVVTELAGGRGRRAPLRLGELPGEAAGEDPADERRGGGADADQDHAGRHAVHGQVEADAEQHPADQPARGARRDAEPEDVAAGDHARQGVEPGRV
jgi:cysteinyl-tRNA synthetase/tRNA/rRNA methyltransferase